MDYLLMLFLALLGILVPIFNTEVSFLAMTYRDNHLLALSAAAALGSTLGYMVLYTLGKKSRNFSTKIKEKVDRIDLNKFKKSAVLVMGTSFTLSLPPCTPLSIAAGALRYNIKKFFVFALIFRFLKYGALAYFFDAIHGYLQVVIDAFSRYMEPLMHGIRSFF